MIGCDRTCDRGCDLIAVIGFVIGPVIGVQLSSGNAASLVQQIWNKRKSTDKLLKKLRNEFLEVQEYYEKRTEQVRNKSGESAQNVLEEYGKHTEAHMESIMEKVQRQIKMVVNT